ncbi:MAG: metal ABC transporter permease [Nitrospirae bacterium]|nr:metal ABC transporter permease [Nitrospirota bacterium]
MMEGASILWPAAVMVLLLVGPHVYLGLHVLERGIIFVDLSMAQIAALGSVAALLAGWEPGSLASSGLSHAFAVMAALGFAGLRRVPDKTYREVLIGIVYVTATALALVLLSRSPHGAEAIKSMLSGNILWTTPGQLVHVGLLYSGVTAALAVFHRRWTSLSRENASGRAAFFWEAGFFGLFALTITNAVEVAGVLMVFAYLIIPAFVASVWTGSFGRRLAFGWGFGTAASLLGVSLSYGYDLPTGATIVTLMGVLAGVLGGVRRFGASAV